MRHLHQSYDVAKHMPAHETMKYFIDNFLGEINMILKTFDMKPPTRGEITFKDPWKK